MTDIVTRTLAHDEYETLKAKADAWDALNAGMPVPMVARSVNDELIEALHKCLGYMLNALFDLEGRTPKKTATDTLNGGIKMVRKVIAQHDPIYPDWMKERDGILSLHAEQMAGEK